MMLQLKFFVLFLSVNFCVDQISSSESESSQSLSSEEATTPTTTTTTTTSTEPPNDGNPMSYSFFNKLYTNQDYCNPSLCDLYYSSSDEYHQEPNIACNNTGQLGPSCPPSAALIDISPYADYILELHNNKRNNISSGFLKPFPPAANMFTMEWNMNLQYMAELNCKRCQYAHDKCRNLPDFPQSGQNIAIDKSSNYKDANTSIHNLFMKWFDEYKLATVEDLEDWQGTGETIGHFTQIVHQYSFAVGCGVIQYKDLDESDEHPFKTYFVCNYATGNVELIYTTSDKAGSGCQSGKNKKYKGLCSLDEPIKDAYLKVY